MSKFFAGVGLGFFVWLAFLTLFFAVFYYSRLRSYRKDRDSIIDAVKYNKENRYSERISFRQSPPSVDEVAWVLGEEPEYIHCRIRDMVQQGINISVNEFGKVVLQE